MMSKLPELLHEWLDGEHPNEEFKEELLRDAHMRRNVRSERQLRVLIGHAFGRDFGAKDKVRFGHIRDKDMAAYYDESLSIARMQAISKHLVKCTSCFNEYMKLYLLGIDSIESESIPWPGFRSFIH